METLNIILLILSPFVAWAFVLLTIIMGKKIASRDDGCGHDSGTEYYYRPDMKYKDSIIGHREVFDQPYPARLIIIILVGLIPLLGAMHYCITWGSLCLWPRILYYLGYR